jgi:hypothetical protein
MESSISWMALYPAKLFQIEMLFLSSLPLTWEQNKENYLGYCNYRYKTAVQVSSIHPDCQTLSYPVLISISHKNPNYSQ